MKDWIQRLNAILQLNGSELLIHTGNMSHQMALNKSETEHEKFKEEQKGISKETSLKEIEEDIKKLKPQVCINSVF